MTGDTDERRDDLEQTITRIARDVEACMERQIDDPMFANVYEMLTYQPGTGGKRLRPALAAMVCEAFGGKYDDVIEVATACEVLHTGSLILDDIVDQDETRRGKPTMQSAFGAGCALMGGTIFVMLAMKIGFDRSVPIGRILLDTASAMAIGNTEEMVSMKHTLDEYLRIISLKTASLFQAPCEIGAIMAYAGRKNVAIARDYGFNVGMMYQVLDDLVDVLNSDYTGRSVGDVKQGRSTLAFRLTRDRVQDPEVHSVLNRIRDGQDVTPDEYGTLMEAMAECGAISDCYNLATGYRDKAESFAALLPTNKASVRLAYMPTFMWDSMAREIESRSVNR